MDLSKIREYAASINKLIGAVVGGGIITLLVGLHVIPSSVGNTVLTLLGMVAAALGAFAAPSNAPVTPKEKDFDTGPGSIADEGLEAGPFG